MENRINNLAEIYPKDKIKLIISNDGASDYTKEIAKKRTTKTLPQRQSHHPPPQRREGSTQSHVAA